MRREALRIPDRSPDFLLREKLFHAVDVLRVLHHPKAYPGHFCHVALVRAGVAVIKRLQLPRQLLGAVVEEGPARGAAAGESPNLS